MRDQEEEEDTLDDLILPAASMLRKRQRELAYLALAVIITWIILFLLPKVSSFESWLTAGVGCVSGRAGVLSHSSATASAYGIRGRRATMEDRFFTLEVPSPTREKPSTKVWAVLDGHGGNFSAVFVRRVLSASLEKKIKLLKTIVDPALTVEKKLEAMETVGMDAPSSATLAADGISNEDYHRLRPLANSFLKPKSPIKDRGKGDRQARYVDAPVLSSRVKPIEELAVADNFEGEKRTIESVLSLNTDKAGGGDAKTKKTKKSKTAKPSRAESKDPSSYISPSGAIRWPLLLKDEIADVDARLLVECRKNGHIGGTTLIVAVLDRSTLWVANVGDSRGVMGIKGELAAKTLSYDHKPSQDKMTGEAGKRLFGPSLAGTDLYIKINLKERKRVEEAGGFVSLNGVWRVQGILATSRALGDAPLKNRGLVTSEPDVLSFDATSGDLAVLATDGLWDVMTNDETVATARKAQPVDGETREAAAARTLAEMAYDRGSTDNVTAAVIRLDGGEASDKVSK